MLVHHKLVRFFCLGGVAFIFSSCAALAMAMGITGRPLEEQGAHCPLPGLRGAKLTQIDLTSSVSGAGSGPKIRLSVQQYRRSQGSLVYMLYLRSPATFSSYLGYLTVSCDNLLAYYHSVDEAGVVRSSLQNKQSFDEAWFIVDESLLYLILNSSTLRYQISSNEGWTPIEMLFGTNMTDLKYQLYTMLQ